jgi:predicted RND superfamily exporter protein
MANLFAEIGRFVRRHAVMVLSVLIVLTVAIGFGVTKIKMTMGNEMFVSKSSDLYQDSKNIQNISVVIRLSSW